MSCFFFLLPIADSLLREIERPENSVMHKNLLQLKNAVENSRKERDLLQFLVQEGQQK